MTVIEINKNNFKGSNKDTVDFMEKFVFTSEMFQMIPKQDFSKL